MWGRIEHYIDLTDPGLDDLAQASQLAAGEWYQVAANHLQANWPRVGGYLAWVFKRPWPVFSGIMLVDGWGQPGAEYYFLARSFADDRIAILPETLLHGPEDDLSLALHVRHRGTRSADNWRYRMRVLDLQWNELHRVEGNVPSLEGRYDDCRIEPASFKRPPGRAGEFLVVVADLLDADGDLVHRDVLWPRFARGFKGDGNTWSGRGGMKSLASFMEEAPATKLEIETIGVVPGADDRSVIDIRITNVGQMPAFLVHVDVSGDDRLLIADDNFFWLDPFESRTSRLAVRWRDSMPREAAVEAKAYNAPTAMTNAKIAR
jgi:beta-mannosidase